MLYAVPLNPRMKLCTHEEYRIPSSECYEREEYPGKAREGIMDQKSREWANGLDTRAGELGATVEGIRE